MLVTEENIYSNCGIDSPASVILWDLVKDNKKTRNRIITIIKNYQAYYKSLDDIKDPKIRIHLHNLIMHTAKLITIKAVQPKINTYLGNVLQFIYKKSLENANKHRKTERLRKKLHAALRKSYNIESPYFI